MEFRPPVPRNLATWGWPWHGLILEPQVGDSYIQLPNGKTHTPPRTPISSMQGGHWSYLWDIGLPDREATPDEIEQGMAWWGRAALRSRGVGVGQVYGRIDMAGLAGSGSWPVLLDDGVAWVRLDASQAAGSSQWTLRFTFKRTIIGAEPIAPVEVTLPPADYGQGEGQPDVFTTRVESPSAQKAVTGTPGIYDFTPDGRSALAAFAAVYNLPYPNDGGHNLAGLLRIDISGPLAAPSVNVSVLHDRRSALGELVHEYTGGMRLATFDFAPQEKVSEVQEAPVCGVTEYVTAGAIVENTTGFFQAYVGTDSSTWGQKGALAAAWFEGGTVKEVRFDSMAVMTATSTTNDASSGEWRTRDTYVYSSATGQCERTETYNVDSRVIDFHARRVEDATYTLRLYEPDGGEQTTTLRRLSTMDGRFFPSDPAQTIDAQSSTVYQGGEEFETTSSSGPGILGGALRWGYPLTNDAPCYSLVNGYWQMSTLDHSVLFCSNKLVTLGQLERLNKAGQRGPYKVQYGPLVSPSGLIAPGVTLTVPDTEPRPGEYENLAWSSVYVEQATKAAWNPITHEVCRHRLDVAGFGWV